jgi:hypothetical protein
MIFPAIKLHLFFGSSIAMLNNQMVNIFHQDIAKSEVSPSKESKESKAQLMEVSMDGELYYTLFTFRTMYL